MDSAVADIIESVTKDDRRHMEKWRSVPRWLRKYEDQQSREWTPERDAIADLMAEGDDRPSGISGIDPDYFRVKALLVFRGRQALEIISKRGFRR